MVENNPTGLSRYSFGMTAAIITSMGIIAGLSYGSASRSSIVAGLIIVAVADNIADTLSIHIYKESEGANRHEISLTTYGNFLVRLLVVASFTAIVLLLPAGQAVTFCSIWGMILLAILSYSIAKLKNASLYYEIARHLIVAILVVIGSKFLGILIAKYI